MKHHYCLKMNCKMFKMLLLTTALLNELNCTLESDFFTEKKLRSAVICDCYANKRDELKVLKKYMAQGMWISVFNINSFNIFQPFITKTSRITGIVINADCIDAEKLILNIGTTDLFNSKHSWLVKSSFLNVIRYFNKTNLNLAADVTVAVRDGQKLTLFDVYNPCFRNGGRLHTKLLGEYNKKNKTLFRRKNSKYSRGRNMKEVQFKSKIVLPAHFDGPLDDYLASDENRYVNTFPRFHYRLLQHCQEYYGYKLSTSLSNSWGYKQRNGQFDGVLGAVMREEIDFPVAPLALREDRFFAITYGQHTWLLRSSFVFRDKKATVSMKTFFKPLGLPVWIFTIVSAILLSVMLKLAFYVEKTITDDIDFSWSYAFFITIATFCQQGNYSITSSFSARIIVIFTLILSLLIYQFYSGGIMSFLLMKPSTTIKTISDIDNSGMNVGLEDIIYIRDFFNRSTDTAIQHLYKKHTRMSKNNSVYIPATAGMELVAKGNYAFDVDLATAYPIIEKQFSGQEICELREVPLYVRQIYFYVKKWSSLKDMFDICLHRLAEYGMIYRQLRHWHHRKPICINSHEYRTFNLSLNEVYPPFCVLFIGIVGSIIVLGAEYICKYMPKRFKQEPKFLTPFFK